MQLITVTCSLGPRTRVSRSVKRIRLVHDCGLLAFERKSSRGGRAPQNAASVGRGTQAVAELIFGELVGLLQGARHHRKPNATGSGSLEFFPTKTMCFYTAMKSYIVPASQRRGRCSIQLVGYRPCHHKQYHSLLIFYPDPARNPAPLRGRDRSRRGLDTSPRLFGPRALFRARARQVIHCSVSSRFKGRPFFSGRDAGGSTDGFLSLHSASR